MSTAQEVFQPGSLVRARGREWVVLPENREQVLRLRPLGGSEEDATTIFLPLEPTPPVPATFQLPDATKAGSQTAALLLRDSLRLKLRAGAGPFRSFGNIGVEPRAYQLVPLLMALRLETVRLLIADDVGVGKTIEAGLIVRELLDRGEVERMTVICPPHLCEQWQEELAAKFNIQAEVVRTGTAGRLERGLMAGQSIFEEYPFTIVSLDYIKADRRRDEFLRACPELVIVEEAHSSVRSGGNTRHQRYQLLKGLADDPNRHMLFLTATPHSGDEEAFYNLLGLLRPDFKQLQGVNPADRKELREDLARYFVQRRRPDIREWQDSTVFPDRESAETTYALTGDWKQLFDDVLHYAREMVKQTEGLSLLKQRMSWWAALALLRCISSSPAAAAMALRTRLESTEEESEESQIALLEKQASETVLDGDSEETLNQDESVPAGTVEDTAALKNLIKRVDKLKGPKNDPKLEELISQLKDLVSNGFQPVVFCRYIATAHYVAEHLQSALKRAGVEVMAVTGELTPEEREEKVHGLSEFAKRLLVATDCLSEGINLQNLFNAVVHYDLTWNPTRHEQREGRVDRFGQPSPKVRVLMYYGENNPVDGAVLQVILRKAERIRKELGVTVPMPSDSNKVMDAIMQTVLLKEGSLVHGQRQFSLVFDDLDNEVDMAWESAKEKAKQSQTIFAQRRLKPEDVLPEWEKAIQVLGGESDVERFVTRTAERLRAPLEPTKNHFRFPLQHMAPQLRERLAGVGLEGAIRITFTHPAPSGVEYVHRAHPLVATLAEHVAERALEEEEPELAARCGAIFTREVKTRTTVFLLRLRSQLMIERREGNRFVPHRTLLSEECLGVAVEGSSEPRVLPEKDALAWKKLESARNMEPAQKAQMIEAAKATVEKLQLPFSQIARKRADQLLADHRRVREASDAKGVRYDVKACLPVDVIGIYVLAPAVTF
ncbi:helicase domain protein [Magnetococcus marinus MC-1]|uniref:Helicase domain protein n=1 Tax=Magnetococcus marinus (strain ATCC BAA-1437 / JCM 17883 / MC-1) TaxID=156889 RepID=A0L974_MAGMM|nr:helicase-related protein [Magnetococcus marinus]ABK44517.1 helicase domain protein [Magnetococcus marinus MC-1]